MEILVRNKGKKEWQKVSEQRFQNEAELQNILYESPEIIPIEQLGENLPKPKLFIKEAGLPGSGNTDLIGIDENGGITIIECKLATNTDIRRKVIGQVFEYAAYLWQMTYDQFDDICCKAEKWEEKHLADLIREKMEGTEETWVEDDFRNNVASTLSGGNFRLIIAVDTLNDELRRIIQFLNSKGGNFSQIYALEMRQFPTEGLQMLVPELYGQSLPTSSKPPIPPIDEQIFRSKSSERCWQLYRRLKELAEHEVFKATSFTKRGFAFRYQDKGNLFVLYPDWLEMWLHINPSESFLDRDTHERFWSKVFQVPAFRSKMDKKTPVVTVDDEAWTEDDVNTFVAAVQLLETLT